MLALGIKFWLLLVPTMFSVWFVSPRPAEMPARLIVCGPAFSRIAGGLAIGLSVGAWLTGLTVTLKVRVKVLTPPLAVPPLSITVTVIVAVPVVLGAGA